MQRLFGPSLHLKTLIQLVPRLDRLKEIGINAIVLDKDNCITLPHQLNLHPSVVPALSQITRQFPTAILSNSAGSFKDVGMKQADQLENSLCIPVIRHNSMKPFCFPKIINHFTTTLQLRDPKIAIVGDRLLTDILMGNLNNCYTILVDPLDSKQDSVSIRLVRRLEHCLLGLTAKQKEN